MRRISIIILIAVFMALALFVVSCSQSTSPPPEDLLRYSMIDYYPSWSPQNNLIAYIHGWVPGSSDPDSTGIYVIRPDGSEKRLIYKGTLNASVDWSPDGSRLIANAKERIIMISYPDWVVDTLTDVGEYWGIVWSPDGTRFAFSKRRGPERGIYIMGSNPDSARLIARYGDFVNWPYEDSLVYFDQSQEFLYNIVISDTEGIGKRIIYTPPGNINTTTIIVKLNVASNRIIIRQQEGGKYPSIWKMNQGGTNATKLISHAETPEFYSGGDSIIFCDTHEKNGRLWIISWNGSGLRQLTHE